MRNRNITALWSTCVFLVFVACDLHTLLALISIYCDVRKLNLAYSDIMVR